MSLGGIVVIGGNLKVTIISLVALITLCDRALACPLGYKWGVDIQRHGGLSIASSNPTSNRHLYYFSSKEPIETVLQGSRISCGAVVSTSIKGTGAGDLLKSLKDIPEEKVSSYSNIITCNLPDGTLITTEFKVSKTDPDNVSGLPLDITTTNEGLPEFTYMLSAKCYKLDKLPKELNWGSPEEKVASSR